VPSPDADYRDIARHLPPTAVSQYLAATGNWILERRQPGVREIWDLPAAQPSPAPDVARRTSRGRIMLPLATDFVDFGQHFRDALGALAAINNWTPLQLEREILATHADLFLVRLEQEQAGDLIPLRQAETTVEAIYKMLRAAAMITAAPNQRFRGGRLPAPVAAFLEEGVQLGHTQRGSFVFTIVARLDNRELGLDIQAPQFSRRVMETLALGIRTARDLAAERTDAALDDPADWGLSASLIESLEDIAAPEGLRSVDLTFEWAVAEARPEVGTEPVRLDHALLGELARLREQLLRREEPVRRETLIGTVVSLSREEDIPGDDEAASVIISAEVNGRRRNVRLALAGRQHELAIQAYRLKLPMVVTGDLVVARRAWRLEGNIDIDEDILGRGIADARRNEGGQGG
jgi:hypothetical protein